MAILHGAPNWSMIGRLKPPLDYYQWKGMWVARIYPVHIQQPGTVAQRKTWDNMNIAVDGWNDLGKRDRVAFRILVRDSHRSGKDFYYRIHLMKEGNTSYPWGQIKIQHLDWFFWGARGIFKTVLRCHIHMGWCNGSEQRKAWGWLKEGYCIRGRKWIRKRRLHENWHRKVDQNEVGDSTTHTFNFIGAQNYPTLYFKSIEVTKRGYVPRGMTGVFVFNKGEVYP